jgi:hypothetical protein
MYDVSFAFSQYSKKQQQCTMSPLPFPFKLSVPEATANATVIVVLSPSGPAAVMALPLAEANA